MRVLLFNLRAVFGLGVDHVVGVVRDHLLDVVLGSLFLLLCDLGPRVVWGGISDLELKVEHRVSNEPPLGEKFDLSF